MNQGHKSSNNFKAKTHGYLKENIDEDKKAKGTKRCLLKRKLKFEDYKNCMEFFPRKYCWVEVYVQFFLC